jgi:hypothetical protein
MTSPLPTEPSSSSIAEYRLPVPQPEGFKVEKLDNKLKITTERWDRLRWFALKPFWLLVFQVGWTISILYLFSLFYGLVAYLISSSLLASVIIYSTLLMILFAPTIYFVSLYFNRTIITVTPTFLSAKPYPVFYPEYKRLNTREIKQLYVKEKYHSLDEDFPLVSYDLNILLNNNESHPLMKNLGEVSPALYLEQEIERFLRLENQRVAGELGYEWYKTEINKRTIWKGLAIDYHLDFILNKISGSALICGLYRGCHLELSTLLALNSQQKPVHFTRLILKLISPAPIETPQSTFAELEGRLATGIASKHRILFTASVPFSKRITKGIYIDVEMKAWKITCEWAGVETDKAYLQRLFDLMVDLAMLYYRLAKQGGEVISGLLEIAFSQSNVLQPVALQLLQEIAQETTERLKDQAGQLICPMCLTACAGHQIIPPRPDKLFTYYGCRICSQSREFLPLKSLLVAVLDKQMAQKYEWHEEAIYGNWLLFRQLFDFDEVHIRQASDEDIERFAVQVGNDTDPIRQPRYATMRCIVSPASGLSENSLKILEHTFGQVEIKSQAQPELQEKAETSRSRIDRLDSETEEGMAEDAQEIQASDS